MKISPKYGVNPTIPKCFFCLKEKNEVALLGKLKGDKEAPRSCILDYEPCDNCKEIMNKGVTLLAVTDAPNVEGQPPMGDKYPTGQFMVIKTEAAKRITGYNFLVDGGKIMVEPELLYAISESAK